MSEQELCADEDLMAAIEEVRRDEQEGLERLVALIEDFPRDPRLHFMNGSILAGLQRYDEGHAAMAQAIDIAPNYAIARFQLGFLELTSNRPDEAVATWAPLENLPSDDTFRVLAQGLRALIRDEFDEAADQLRLGMSLNTEHPLINADMQLLLEEMDALKRKSQLAPSDEPEAASEAHFLLQQYELKSSVNHKKH